MRDTDLPRAAPAMAVPSPEQMRNILTVLEKKPDVAVIAGTEPGIFFYCVVDRGVITGWTIESCTDPAARKAQFEAQSSFALAWAVSQAQSAAAPAPSSTPPMH